jgi:hypothetical protein
VKCPPPVASEITDPASHFVTTRTGRSVRTGSSAPPAPRRSSEPWRSWASNRSPSIRPSLANTSCSSVAIVRTFVAMVLDGLVRGGRIDCSPRSIRSEIYVMTGSASAATFCVNRRSHDAKQPEQDDQTERYTEQPEQERPHSPPPFLKACRSDATRDPSGVEICS